MLKIAAKLLVLVVICTVLTSRPAAADPLDCVAWGLDKPNQLHCFQVTQGQLWHKGWWDGGWHAWQNLGKPNGVSLGMENPDCLAWGLSKPDQLHCFVEDDTNSFHLWHIGWYGRELA